MDKKPQKEIELDALINQGATFDVEEVSKKWPFGLKKRKLHTFIVYSPVLAVCDLINRELSGIEVNEGNMGMDEGRRLMKLHARRMSRVVAIAVLGNDCFSKVAGRYVENRLRIGKMADMFHHNINPAKLRQLAEIVAVMSDLPGFVNSIRLLQVAPDRIEPRED